MAELLPRLVPLTGAATQALAGARWLALERLPFRVGRESRAPAGDRRAVPDERRRGIAEPNNDLYIWDPGPLLNVSREHFQIERAADGGFLVRDRGSTCGTLVDGVKIGAGGAKSRRLNHDSVITVGTFESPFQFRFELAHPERKGDSALKKAEAIWKRTPPDPRRS